MFHCQLIYLQNHNPILTYKLKPMALTTIINNNYNNNIYPCIISSFITEILVYSILRSVKDFESECLILTYWYFHSSDNINNRNIIINMQLKIGLIQKLYFLGLMKKHLKMLKSTSTKIRYLSLFLVILSFNYTKNTWCSKESMIPRPL